MPIFVVIIIVILLMIGVALQPSASDLPVSTSLLISTLAQDKYTEALITYVAQLEQEGLVTAKEIRVEGSQPFIFILKPQTQEITDENVKNVTELALRTLSIFESRGGLKHEDIDVAFYRPTEQKIVLINRPDMPELLSADTYGEVTIAIDKSYFTSLVNFAGPHKNGNQDFANAWSVIQAICLAYTGDFQDRDPVCNVISANAAAGWVGMGEEESAEIINSYGMTELGYLGSKDYQYRFIDFVYRAFIH